MSLEDKQLCKVIPMVLPIVDEKLDKEAFYKPFRELLDVFSVKAQKTDQLDEIEKYIEQADEMIQMFDRARDLSTGRFKIRLQLMYFKEFKSAKAALYKRKVLLQQQQRMKAQAIFAANSSMNGMPQFKDIFKAVTSYSKATLNLQQQGVNNGIGVIAKQTTPENDTPEMALARNTALAKMGKQKLPSNPSLSDINNGVDFDFKQLVGAEDKEPPEEI